MSHIPIPSHRHGAPSAPWPWMDIDDEIDSEQLSTSLPPVPPDCDHQTCNGRCWKKYPGSRFPNWTKKQVEKSGIDEAIHKYDKEKPCNIYYVDVNDDGLFKDFGCLPTDNYKPEKTWETIMSRVVPKSGLRVRALFLDRLSGPVLQMLGAKYNIEPFFFSSSLNWIPSRYQESVKEGDSDHITVCVSFLRSIVNERNTSGTTHKTQTPVIDINAPFDITVKQKGRQLVLDFLSVHLIRRREDASVIISYHPSFANTTTAEQLQERISLAGRSVYWQNMFQKSPDPTFVLLTYIWHTVYAWDEALEHLYIHMTTLEINAMSNTEKTQRYVTQQLHTIRARLLHYASLLQNLRKSVEFIGATRNPALDASEITDEQRKFSEHFMRRECESLLDAISRLDDQRNMQAKRLKNVMGLVFNSVNIEDSSQMRKMTEAAVRDSAGIGIDFTILLDMLTYFELLLAMKQIAYLTMIFLPASYVATVFGMNIQEVTDDVKATLGHYVAAAIPMTAITVWIIVALHSKDALPKTPLHIRLGWPYLFLKTKLEERRKPRDDDGSSLVPLNGSAGSYNMV